MDRQYDVILECNETPAQLRLLLPLTLWSGLWLSTPLLYSQCESHSGHFLIKIVINKSCDSPPMPSVRHVNCDQSEKAVITRVMIIDNSTPHPYPWMQHLSLIIFTQPCNIVRWETVWWFSSRSLLIIHFCVLYETDLTYHFLWQIQDFTPWTFSPAMWPWKNGSIKKRMMSLLSWILIVNLMDNLAFDCIGNPTVAVTLCQCLICQHQISITIKWKYLFVPAS